MSAADGQGLCGRAGCFRLISPPFCFRSLAMYALIRDLLFRLDAEVSHELTLDWLGPPSV